MIDEKGDLFSTVASVGQISRLMAKPGGLLIQCDGQCYGVFFTQLLYSDCLHGMALISLFDNH